jgi:hypothetical protein
MKRPKKGITRLAREKPEPAAPRLEACADDAFGRSMVLRCVRPWAVNACPRLRPTWVHGGASN